MAGSGAEVPAGAVAAGGTAPGGGLGRHPKFLSLGGAQSESLIGAAVSYLALPLVGVVVLKLGPLQMGLIATAGRVPAAVVSPVIGSFVDPDCPAGLSWLPAIWPGPRWSVRCPSAPLPVC
jgi:hypothetical protein